MSIEHVIDLLKKGEVVEALNLSDNVSDKKTLAKELTDFAGFLGEYRGHPDLCIAILLKSLKFDPQNPDTCYNIGNMMAIPWKLEEDSDNVWKAVKWFDKALEIDPSHTDSRYNKSLLFYLTGRIDEAKNEYAKLRELNPSLDSKYDELKILLEHAE